MPYGYLLLMTKLVNLKTYDVITNITLTDTPFTSSIRTEKVNARIFEFQEDTLAAVTQQNGWAY